MERLGSELDLGGRQRVVAVLRVGEEDPTVGVEEGERVVRGRRQSREGAEEGAFGREVKRLLGHGGNRLGSVGDPQAAAGHRAVHVHAHGKVDQALLARRPREMHNRLGVRPRDAADLPHRHPVLGEPDRLLRPEEAVGLLVAEEARLDLHVGALVVGEGLPPVEAVGVAAPGPDLLGGSVFRRGVMDDAGAFPWVINAHEGLATAVGEERDRAVELVPDDREVDALRVHRPGVHLAEPVGRGVAHRVGDPAVVVHAHPGIVPPVEAPPNRARIVEGDVLLEEGRARPQAQLHPPLHAVDPVHVGHPDGGAAVRVRAEREVHRGERDPVVGDRKVELDAEG